MRREGTPGSIVQALNPTSSCLVSRHHVRMRFGDTVQIKTSVSLSAQSLRLSCVGTASSECQQVPQQMGMLFIITQQEQPASIIVIMQSQHA